MTKKKTFAPPPTKKETKNRCCAPIYKEGNKNRCCAPTCKEEKN